MSSETLSADTYQLWSSKVPRLSKALRFTRPLIIEEVYSCSLGRRNKGGCARSSGLFGAWRWLLLWVCPATGWLPHIALPEYPTIGARSRKHVFFFCRIPEGKFWDWGHLQFSFFLILFKKKMLLKDSRVLGYWYHHAGGTYSSAPDTPSPIYPDRLIRPLPKRPIRSRLSPEAAESILLPPAPPVNQLFYGAYTTNGGVHSSKVFTHQNDYRLDPGIERDHHYDDGVDSGEDEDAEIIRRSTAFQRSSLSPPAPGDNRQKYTKHIENIGASSKAPSSGPDGYDAFENTNNKKKRKIPTSGNLASHSSLSAEIANMGLSSGSGDNCTPLDDGNGTGSYYGTGHPAMPAGNGISGPGRGRYGRNVARSSSGRIPLSVHNPNNAWLGGRSGYSRREVLALGLEPFGMVSPCGFRSFIFSFFSFPWKKKFLYWRSWSDDPTYHAEQGIISTAIANAAALSSSAPQGQENVSLLEQTRKPSPAKTQFTFTCESSSSKGMAWQSQTSYPIPQFHRTNNQPVPGAPPRPRGFSTQGTQTSPNMTASASQQAQATPQQHAGQSGQNAAAGKKTRRSPGSLYALAARQRRLQQQYTNLHHPPSLEDIWICEFCEYESIFGRPPEALIRQYEIKDRKERRRLAEKRRLLEKAKMKGRKGKKSAKNASAKGNAAQQPTNQQQGYDRNQTAHPPSGEHDNDYIGDEFEDDIAAPAPPHIHPHDQSYLPSTIGAMPDPATLAKDPPGGGPGRGGWWIAVWRGITRCMHTTTPVLSRIGTSFRFFSRHANNLGIVSLLRHIHPVLSVNSLLLLLVLYFLFKFLRSGSC